MTTKVECLRNEQNSKVDYPKFKEELALKESDPLLADIEKATGSIATLNEAKLLTTGPEAFSKFEKCIEDAEKSVKINVFSWADDPTGKRMAEQLIAAKKAKPDLDVTVQVDVLGSLFVGSKDDIRGYVLSNLSKATEIATENGITIGLLLDMYGDATSVYNLPKETQKNLEKFLNEFFTDNVLLEINDPLRAMHESGVSLILERNLASQMDHSKIFIFDDNLSFTGGMNVGDDYSGGFDAESQEWNRKVEPAYWKDYMVSLNGPATQLHEDLSFGDKKFVLPPNMRATSQIRVLHNKPGDNLEHSEKQITYATHRLIKNAKEEIILEHAYIMDDGIVDMLNEAANRGVSVIIVRSQPESSSLEAANEKYFQKLDPKIIVRKSDRVLHTKLMAVDSKYSVIGSANLTTASMEQHEESSILVSGKGPLQEQIERQCAAIRKMGEVQKDTKSKNADLLSGIYSNLTKPLRK